MLGERAPAQSCWQQVAGWQHVRMDAGAKHAAAVLYMHCTWQRDPHLPSWHLGRSKRGTRVQQAPWMEKVSERIWSGAGG
jgi:hypothetical protein